MITIKGKQFSEETVIEALEKHCNFKEPYVFQSGDIITFGNRLRIMLKIGSELTAFRSDGIMMANSQKDFEGCCYKKVGTLNDFIKEN